MTSTTFFIIFIPILAILLLAINLILAPHNPYQEKDSVFECGFHSFLGQNRTQFSVSFFIFALLFLLFDLEILLVYPFSVSGYTNDIYGLVIMMVFFVLLSLGFVFELGKNALTIDSRQTSSYNSVDISEYYAFLSRFYIIYIIHFISIGVLLTIAANMLGIYPAPILDGLAYAVSLLLYSSDIIVAASSVPLSSRHKDLLKKADSFSDNRASQVSSINEIRRESSDDKALIEASVRKEAYEIEKSHGELNSQLELAKFENPSKSADFQERIDLIKDAKDQALSTLAETKETTLELIDDVNSSFIFLIVGEGILAEALLGPFFVLVSLAFKLYGNKSFRYIFKVWFSTLRITASLAATFLFLTVLVVSLVSYPTGIFSGFAYIFSALIDVNYDIPTILEGFFTSTFVFNTKKKTSDKDEIEIVDWTNPIELSGRYRRWRCKRSMLTGEKICHVQSNLDADIDEYSITPTDKLEEDIAFGKWELGKLKKTRAEELQQEASFMEQQTQLKRKRELENPVKDQPPKRHPSGWTPVNWPPVNENVMALITTWHFSVSSFIKYIVVNSRPVLNIIMSLLFAALAVKCIIYIDILMGFFSVDYIRTAVSILLSVLFFSIKLLLMIRRANKSAALYNTFFNFLANHYVSGILYFSILLLSVGLVYLCI